jgi:hypothetical protein
MTAAVAVKRWVTGLVIGLAVATVLSGCALPRMIDTDVQSFAAASPIAPGSTYRFERLPSQVALASRHDAVEAMADASMAKVGMVRNDAQARYSVQVELGVVQFYPEPRLPMIHERPWRTADGKVVYPPMRMVLPEPPWYSYTVHLLMREVATALVAYETTANFQSPWSDGGNLVPIVMDAALQGFPTPPTGPRKVLTELIPREASPQ